MKWTNKGHEFDAEWQKLNIDENKSLKFYIFGAGLRGRSLCARIMESFTKLGITDAMGGFIDNAKEKQGTYVDGYMIISIEDFLKIEQAKILVDAKKEYMAQMVEQLKALGLKQNKDYFFAEEFYQSYFPLISVYYYKKNYVRLAQICVTERCTLKCKDCAHGCYAVNNRDSIDLTIEQVKKSADCFFGQVSYVEEFTLLGGEPLIYTELAEAIGYIGQNYRSQIGEFYITSNGTVIPNVQVIKACKEYKASFLLSDYTKQVPRVKKQFEKCVEVLHKNEIAYEITKEEFEWIDFGFSYVNHKEPQVISVFDNCKTDCREIRENKYYYCVMARSISDNLGLGLGEDDYLDLDAINKADASKIFYEFSLGYSEKGYLDMCRHCNSMSTDKRVLPGKQMK